MSMPIVIALLLGKLLKSHEGVPNRLIPWLLFGQQILQELGKQLQGAPSAAHIDPVAAIAAAAPVVAGAVLTHNMGKGLSGFLRSLLPSILPKIASE